MRRPTLGGFIVACCLASGSAGATSPWFTLTPAFITGAAFDPDSTHDVHVTLSNTGSAGTMFAVSLTSGSGLWTQTSPTALRWRYHEPLSPPPLGIRLAKLSEKPAGTNAYVLKAIGRGASIVNAPLNLATDDIAMLVEIEAGGSGVCFATTLTTCAGGGSRDYCKP